MKKAFSLMEVIISIVILSFVMITLIQIRNENIFLVSKSNQKNYIEDYIILSIGFNDDILDKNENIFLSDKYNFENDDIRKELKDIQIDIKDKKLESKNINSEFNINMKTNILYRDIKLQNSDFTKKLYKINIDL
ncbi:type IV pilus modification PilV family protein [Aliarcobacter butzleri]|uniref:type IV pilus modification PilV family protein n=1 Tax=Aliarcobacter butzleri TaxID=28197 RepID=UPI0012F71976|nr:prepilin-type N-terminal cleavage/methylation domain-containing protein [Aliarcobacter butzleri]